MVKMEEDEVDLPAANTHSPLFSPLSDAEETEDDDSGGGGSGSEDDHDGAGISGGDGSPPMKKGPWTPEEDAVLKAYVERHGPGNWNRVQRNAGLNRCGKSCRLRWANHLRPDLKKGPFDEEEMDKIIQLHARIGNKWAKMATLLPVRTDNEIKNFWNTRSKRIHRKGSSPLAGDEQCLVQDPLLHNLHRPNGESLKDEVINDSFNIPYHKEASQLPHLSTNVHRDIYAHQLLLQPNVWKSDMPGNTSLDGYTNVHRDMCDEFLLRQDMWRDMPDADMHKSPNEGLLVEVPHLKIFQMNDMHP